MYGIALLLQFRFHTFTLSQLSKSDIYKNNKANFELIYDQ